MKPDAKKKLASTTAEHLEVVRQNHYGRCRALTHEWRHDAPTYDPGNNEVLVTSVCINCTTERTRRISMQGSLSKKGPRYAYPDGYLSNKKKGRPAKTLATWRREFVLDLVNHTDISVA
jgi:hypothetical protein